MIDPVLLVAFFGVAVLLVLTPGPDMLFIVAAGARGGPRSGLAAALGVGAGLAVHAVAVAFGMAAIFHAVPAAYEVVRWCGVAYLLYLGIRTLLAPTNVLEARGSHASSPEWPATRAFQRGVLTNLLNPKVVLFNAAFLPQFVSETGGPVWLQLLALGCCLVLVDLLIDGPIGLLAGRIGTWLQRNPATERKLNIATGTFFIILSGRLATQVR